MFHDQKHNHEAIRHEAKPAGFGDGDTSTAAARSRLLPNSPAGASKAIAGASECEFASPIAGSLGLGIYYGQRPGKMAARILLLVLFG